MTLNQRGETVIVLDGGKYAVFHTNGVGLRATRYGEPWRDLVGDSLVLSMAQEIESLRSQVESANKDADQMSVRLQHDTQALSAEARAYREAFHKCGLYMPAASWQKLHSDAETARATFKRTEVTPTLPLFKEAWNKKIQAGFQWSTDNIAKAQMGWEMAMEEMRIRSYPLIGGSETTHVICICPDCVNKNAQEVSPESSRDTRAAFAPSMAAEALREAASTEIPQPDSPSMVAVLENLADFALMVAQSSAGLRIMDLLGGDIGEMADSLSTKALEFAEAADNNVSIMKNRAEKIRNMLDALNMYASSLQGEREGKLIRSYVDKLRGLCL